MLITVDNEFYHLFSFSLCQPPSEGLKGRTDLDLFVKLEQKWFYLWKIQRSKVCLHHTHLLLDSLGGPTQLLLWEVPYVYLEPILELTLNRSDFVFKRIVTELRLSLLFILDLLVRVVSHYLLFVLLDKCWLQHINPMLSMDFIWVVLKEGFIPV